MRIKTPIKTPFKVPFKITRKGNDFLTDILFPRCCPVYDGIVLPKGNLICPGHMTKLSWVRRPVYKRCGKKALDETTECCRDCARYKCSFDYGLSLINYDDTTNHSMVQTKYNNRRKYLDFCGEATVRRMGERIRSMDGDTLIPVSAHPSHPREGGFNQAEELTRHFSGPLGIPVDTSVLKRERKTAPQKNLDSNGWLENLKQAFTTVALPSTIQEVILVDDIYTIGSTIETCARVLRKAGAERIYFVAISIGHGQ